MNFVREDCETDPLIVITLITISRTKYIMWVWLPVKCIVGDIYDICFDEICTCTKILMTTNSGPTQHDILIDSLLIFDSFVSL